MATLRPIPTQFPSVPWFGSSAFVQGFELDITSATTFTLQPGGARSHTNDYVIQWPTVQPNASANLTCNVATVGANGCYPLALNDAITTNDTALPVYVIGDSSGSQNHNTAIIVATGDNFLLPGYDSFRRVGTIYIQNSSSNIIPMTQSGSFLTRRYQLATGLLALTAGAATTLTQISLNTLALPVPDTAIKVFGNLLETLVPSHGSFLTLSDTATGGNPGQVIFLPSAATTSEIPYQMSISLVAGVPSIYYTWSTVGCTSNITISGWEEDLSINVV